MSENHWRQKEACEQFSSSYGTHKWEVTDVKNPEFPKLRSSFTEFGEKHVSELTLRPSDASTVIRVLTRYLQSKGSGSTADRVRWEETVQALSDLEFDVLESVVKERARRRLDEAGELTEEEMQTIKNGNTIIAIKMVRERTGLGLREAKNVVDKHKPITRF